MAQFSEAVLPGSPLPPKIQTQSSADPRFEVCEDSRGLAETEVAAPSHDVWLQLFDQLLQTEPPRPACHVSDPPLEFVERLWRDAPLAPVIRDAEPEKLSLFRSRHRALRLVDLEPQLVGQEPAHRGHDPFAGATAANIDVAVVSVPAKTVTASGQFVVEVVKHEIAQDGRKRAALRRPLVHRTDQTVFHHPGVEERPDEFEHTLIGHARGDARHRREGGSGTPPCSSASARLRPRRPGRTSGSVRPPKATSRRPAATPRGGSSTATMPTTAKRGRRPSSSTSSSSPRRCPRSAPRSRSTCAARAAGRRRSYPRRSPAPRREPGPTFAAAHCLCSCESLLGATGAERDDQRIAGPAAKRFSN